MLPRFSVKRPVTITMMILVIIILGVVSLSKLPIDLMPNIEIPIAIVQTSYDAGPEEIEKMITKPIEQVVAAVENVDTISSTSSNGSSLIILQFEFGTDMNMATLEMREKIDMIKGFLPDGASSPMVMQFDPTSMPIMEVTVTGSGDFYTTQNVAEDVIQTRIERIEGAASVSIGGKVEKEVQIKLNEDTMKGYGLSTSYVSQIIMAENLNLPGGEVNKGSDALNVRVIGEFESIDDIRNLSIPLMRGGSVRLRDIADVDLVNTDNKSIIKVNGENVLDMTIMKQSNVNTVNVSRAINKELSKIEKDYPNIKFTKVFDQADYIQFSVNNLKNNVITGGALAVVILLLFLKSFKSTLVIALSMPISIISTFILLYFSGITMNMMTIGGMALGVGMLVDNSIVVLENIFRHREFTPESDLAAINGAKEVTTAISASTLTTIAVFVPIVFSGGIAAIIFKELALTVTLALLCSLFVALTLIPMLYSKLMSGSIKKKDSSKPKRESRIKKGYSNLLGWSLKHRIIVVVACFLLFFMSIGLLSMVGAEFIPSTDQGQISVSVKLPTGSSLDDTQTIVENVQNAIKDIPEIDNIFTTAGNSGSLFSSTSSNSGSITVILKPLSDRTRSCDEVADDIRNKSKDIAGAEISVSSVSLTSFTTGTGALTISILGNDTETLEEISEDIKNIVSSVDGTREVSTSFSEGIPEVQIRVDRVLASSYGLTTAQVGSGIKGALAGNTISKYKLNGDEIDIVLKNDSIYKESLTQLGLTPIQTQSGHNVPLSEIADITLDRGPVSISRENQTRVATVSCDVFGRDTQSVTDDVENALKNYTMPYGYTYKFGGEIEEIQSSFSDLALAMELAIILVYMVMAAQFESLIQPLSILFTIPLALSGGLIGLFIFGIPLSVIGIMGFIMLVGIVVNNGIVLIDYINVRRQSGEDRRSAIMNAGPIRLRPIMMTALTTILGLIPMAFGVGEGAELTRGMGIVVVFGLTLSTLFTLIFVPVMYTLFDDLTNKIKGAFGKNKMKATQEN